MDMRTLVMSSALRGVVAALATSLLLLVVNVVAGPGQCATDLVCRVDPNEPTGCAPSPHCEGPGPSLRTAVIAALLVGVVVGVAAVLRSRSRRARQVRLPAGDL
jgi:hypothetical protein